MLRRAFPHPLLSLTMVMVWLLLVNTITPGNLVLAVFFGIVIPLVTAPYWPDRPRLSRPLMTVPYLALVLWDIILANITVAMIILFKREKDIRSGWFCVPLELTSPEAITVLAGTITLTPGTLSAMLSADGRSILVHYLHDEDPDATRAEIKHRYERRLKEIFE